MRASIAPSLGDDIRRLRVETVSDVLLSSTASYADSL